MKTDVGDIRAAQTMCVCVCVWCVYQLNHILGENEVLNCKFFTKVKMKDVFC